MSKKEGASAPPPAILFAADLALVLQLLPRAQIVVGDIPRIYGALQRLEAAVKTGNTFTEARQSKVESGEQTEG